VYKIKFPGLVLYVRQVSPTELEGVIHAHPAVLDVGVVGMPDALAGDLPAAWVVPKSGHNVTEMEILDHVAGNIYSLCSEVKNNI
jgi:acyl-coenzyme A synthetase/AMP-(fatty) acid ligase